MAGFLLLAFIGVPIAEIALFIEIGQRIGLGPTILTVILTAVAGTVLLRAQGFRVLARARAHLDRGELPVDEVFTGICLLVAGALLLTPGFLTDALGLALFVPWIRARLGRAVLRLLLRRGQARIWIDGEELTPPGRGHPPKGRVIDGEYRIVTGAEDEPPSGAAGNEEDRRR